MHSKPNIRYLRFKSGREGLIHDRETKLPMREGGVFAGFCGNIYRSADGVIDSNTCSFLIHVIWLGNRDFCIYYIIIYYCVGAVLHRTHRGKERL